MTAKEQGLPEPKYLAKLSKDGEWAELCPADDWSAEMWAHGTEPVYTAEQMITFRDAALASDTGERGVGLTDAATALVALVEGPGCLRWEDGRGFRLKDTNEWAVFYVAAKNALRAQPAGGGDIPQWALPAVESALAMLDEQGYAHTDLAAFRDWLKESTP